MIKWRLLHGAHLLMTYIRRAVFDKSWRRDSLKARSMMSSASANHRSNDVICAVLNGDSSTAGWRLAAARHSMRISMPWRRFAVFCGMTSAGVDCVMGADADAWRRR